MILIVDDHIDTCRALLLLLRREGVPAECVTEGAAALAVIESLKPVLVVLDQMMRGMRGTDVLRALRDMPGVGETPAVFYSATTDGQEEARRLGALAWIIKGKATWDELRREIVAVYRERASG